MEERKCALLGQMYEDFEEFENDLRKNTLVLI